MNRLLSFSAVGAAAVVLIALFWWPLLIGGGLIGGDVYSYYLPQKVIYAEHLRHAELPLWNDGAGHGYPIVGESQTGPFYPFHVILYRLLGVNAAYNANHLLHYVLAFVITWMYARTIGLSRWSAGFTALVFCYAWFPPRSCWEWAIIGGAWMPAAFWCVERYLQTSAMKFLFALTGVVSLQLLAGHFNLAFLTLLALVPYLVLRVGFAERTEPETGPRKTVWQFALPLGAILCGFALAAVQLAPTWELKQLSQRESPGPNHQLEHGSIPVWYWSQAVRPWYWYSLETDRDAALREAEPQLGARTNQVEAHLYFGLIPLGLAVAEIDSAIRRRDRVSLIWLALALAALLYTPGWSLGVTRHIPGFDFFQGPGRYGIITTLGVAILAGKSLDRLRTTGSLWLSLALLVGFTAAMWTGLRLTSQADGLAQNTGSPNPFVIARFTISDTLVSGLALVGLVAMCLAILVQYRDWRNGQLLQSTLGRIIFTSCALVVTTLDLWLVSRVVTYSVMVANPPINHLEESPARKILAAQNGNARVYSPFPNLGSVLGGAATPVYLTFGPAAYDDPALKMPDTDETKQVAWLQRAGVTHILRFTPFESADLSKWPVRLVWTGFDPLLNPAMGRYNEPFYLYELNGSRGRIAWEHPQGQGPVRITDSRSNRITAEANATSAGRIVLTDLMYPGWAVTVDGTPATAQTVDGMFRGVDVPAGAHTVVWTYRPRVFYWGLTVSVVTLVFLAALAHVRFWHPQRLAFLDPARRS